MSDSEQMQYGMLGEDGSTTSEKLAKYSGECGWDYLKPHYENGSATFCGPWSLPLRMSGAAISEDDKESVERWLKAGDLVKIEALHAAQWEDSEQQFQALVVSPFVLCRPGMSDPLHGVTLEKIVTDLVEHFGWDELSDRIRIRCFANDPSVKSTLKFLRKTGWARNKVEKLYLEMIAE
jgi:hypothetical protein